MTKRRVTWVGVEPTPYLLRVQEAAHDRLDLDVEAVFDSADRSQPWGLSVADGAVVGQSVVATLRWAWSLARHRPDALVVEGWSTRTALLALFVGRLVRARTFVSTDTWQRRPTSRGRAALRWLVVHGLVLPAQGFLPSGSPQAAHLVAMGAEPARVGRLPMVVDVEAIARCCRAPGARVEARHRLAVDGSPVVLYVGRLVPGKGVETALAALALLPAGAVGLFVGDGPLGPLVAASDRARALGRRTGADLWSCFAAADVLVLPSEAEAWGLVVNEAVAAGVPVVVSDGVGSGPDLVGEPARIVPVGDAGAVARAVAAVVEPGRATEVVAEQDRRMADFTLEAATGGLAAALGLTP